MEKETSTSDNEKDDRPSLWIFYHDRFRSPTSTDLYKWMKKNSKLFQVQLVTDTPPGISIEAVMDHRKIPKPDMVLDGFGAYTGILRSKDFIKQNGIKIVRTVADVEVHKGDFGAGHPNHNTDLFVDALYFPVSPDCKPPIDRLNEYREDLITQEDAQLICIPFGVDTDKFNPNREKDIDIMALYMAEKGNMFQMNRLRMNDTLDTWLNGNKHGWPGHNNILQEYMMRVQAIKKEDLTPADQKIIDYAKHRKPVNVYMGTDFYRYPEICNRSKIGFADTSKRDYMTNKYLEIGASGAAIVGEIPYGYGNLFTKDTMFPVDMDMIETELPSVLDYILFNDKGVHEWHKKTRNMRQVILEEYTLERWSDKLESAFIKLL